MIRDASDGDLNIRLQQGSPSGPSADAVLLDGDGRPVCSEMWPGNTADVSTFNLRNQHLTCRTLSDLAFSYRFNS
jgi:hypothetical protein